MSKKTCGYCEGVGTIQPEWSSQPLVCAVCHGTGLYGGIVHPSPPRDAS